MIVCLCHRISERDILGAVAGGVADFESLQDDTCIARGCGCCEDCAQQVFQQALAAKAQPVRIVRRPSLSIDGAFAAA